MKLNKATYLSFFFLLCFVASFGLNTAQNFNSKISQISVVKKNSTSFSTKENSSSGDNTILFEENEKETETKSTFIAQASILPFLISFIFVNENHSIDFQTEPLSFKQTNPIYISACNFRI